MQVITPWREIRIRLRVRLQPLCGMVRGHLIPCAAIQNAAGTFLEYTTPLLKEEGDLTAHTIVPDLSDPVGLKRSGSRPGFSTCNYPVYTLKSQAIQRAK